MDRTRKVDGTRRKNKRAEGVRGIERGQCNQKIGRRRAILHMLEKAGVGDHGLFYCQSLCSSPQSSRVSKYCYKPGRVNGVLGPPPRPPWIYMYTSEQEMIAAGTAKKKYKFCLKKATSPKLPVAMSTPRRLEITLTATRDKYTAQHNVYGVADVLGSMDTPSA